LSFVGRWLFAEESLAYLQGAAQREAGVRRFWHNRMGELLPTYSTVLKSTLKLGRSR
jgi:hypothetical protein